MSTKDAKTVPFNPSASPRIGWRARLTGSDAVDADLQLLSTLLLLPFPHLQYRGGLRNGLSRQPLARLGEKVSPVFLQALGCADLLKDLQGRRKIGMGTGASGIAAVSTSASFPRLGPSPALCHASFCILTSASVLLPSFITSLSERVPKKASKSMKYRARLLAMSMTSLANLQTQTPIEIQLEKGTRPSSVLLLVLSLPQPGHMDDTPMHPYVPLW